MASFAILFRRIIPATSRNRFFGIFLMAGRPDHPPGWDNPFSPPFEHVRAGTRTPRGGPSQRGEGIPLESETPREGIVECDEEAGEREGDEKARHDHVPPPLWLIDDGRTSSHERGGDLKDRKDSEGRKVETSEESDGGAHSDARHHIGGARRATRKERVEGDERPDHRERKRSRRSNREGREDQEDEGRGNRSPVRIGRVDQVTEGTMGPRNQNP